MHNKATNELIHFLQNLTFFSEEEIAALAKLLIVEKIQKDTVLVKQREICSLCFFVLKGCLRQYIETDDAEKTIGFYTEQQAVNFFTSYTMQKPSDSYLSSVEDSVVLIGNPEKDKEIYSAFPKLEIITRKMMEEDFGQHQDAFAHFITSCPEERYLHLQNTRPQLLQRVPQYQLASYLGITPESLSRIRKRIAKQAQN